MFKQSMKTQAEHGNLGPLILQWRLRHIRRIQDRIQGQTCTKKSNSRTAFKQCC